MQQAKSVWFEVCANVLAVASAVGGKVTGLRLKVKVEKSKNYCKWQLSQKDGIFLNTNWVGW